MGKIIEGLRNRAQEFLILRKRKALSKLPVPEGCIGYDCNGEIIKEGDTLEVVVEDEVRKGNPEYDFCSVGQRGKASKSYAFPGGWVVDVTFEEGRGDGCSDYQTKLVKQPPKRKLWKLPIQEH